ncbi:MAG: TonB-dependent receptor [Betaproteobacteria bacterium]|nr:TonB-dependent receptor [Betaproteobacteria bacterium]
MSIVSSLSRRVPLAASRSAPRSHRIGVTPAWLLAMASVAGSALAQPADTAATPTPAVDTLSEVVVSASRQAQRSFNAPASIQSVDAQTIRSAGPMVNLSESLSRVPGVVVLNRQNYAQDLQVSIRGFGARSAFGIRGVRLIVDGIPATMPDGQGQASTVSLASVGRLEVLRGPLALLYGNAAGGVIQAFSIDPPPQPVASASLSAGSEGAQRLGIGASGQAGSASLLADWSRFQTDGYRDHSAARREQFNGIVRWRTDADTRITLVANVFDQPLSQDPLGLTRAQMLADPRQVDASALSQDTRKTVSQNQTGLVAEHRLDADRSLSARLYAGQRAVFQTLSTPLSAQTAATAPGGVVDLDRDYGGIGLQYSHGMPLGESRLTTVIGLDHDRQRERRQGFINNAGVPGQLKRDELNRVQNTDVYALAILRLPADWSLTGGARSSRVDFRSDDRYIVAGNGDDSGARQYQAVSPVLGVSRAIGNTVNVYGNLGRGFETPTFAELAYRSTSGTLTGLNLGLQASRSRQAEVGAKWRSGDGRQRADLALFSIGTDDEIVVDGNVGGRTTYRNAGRTVREGVEFSWHGQLAPTLSGRVAFTWLSARFRDGFVSGSGSAAVSVAAGNRLAGTPDRLAFGELVWRPRIAGPLSGLSVAVEALTVGAIPVNDANTDAAEGYTLFHLRAGLPKEFGAWRLTSFARIDNLADRRHVGSVIVNEGNRRFFEPGPGRAWMAGLTLSTRY